MPCSLRSGMSPILPTRSNIELRVDGVVGLAELGVAGGQEDVVVVDRLHARRAARGRGPGASRGRGRASPRGPCRRRPPGRSRPAAHDHAAGPRTGRCRRGSPRPGVGLSRATGRPASCSSGRTAGRPAAASPAAGRVLPAGQRVDLGQRPAGVDVAAEVVADDARADDRPRLDRRAARGLADPALHPGGDVLLDARGRHAAVERQHLHRRALEHRQDVDRDRRRPPGAPSTTSASDMTVTAIGFRARRGSGRSCDPSPRRCPDLGSETSPRPPAPSFGFLRLDRHPVLERGAGSEDDQSSGPDAGIDFDQRPVVRRPARRRRGRTLPVARPPGRPPSPCPTGRGRRPRARSGASDGGFERDGRPAVHPLAEPTVRDWAGRSRRASSASSGPRTRRSARRSPRNSRPPKPSTSRRPGRPRRSGRRPGRGPGRRPASGRSG